MLIGANQCERGLLPFGKSHVFRLVGIAESARLFPHVGILPSDTNTLHHLTRLSGERFNELIEDGRIHPGMKRNEASAETRAEKKADDHQRINSIVPATGKFCALVIDPPWDYEWLSIARGAGFLVVRMQTDNDYDSNEGRNVTNGG